MQELTFHLRVIEVLFLLASFGGVGGSGSQALVVNFTGSVVFPFISSNEVYTLKAKQIKLNTDDIKSINFNKQSFFFQNSFKSGYTYKMTCIGLKFHYCLLIQEILL